MLIIPGVTTFVPLFVLVSNMGLGNTYLGLILPFLVTPLGVFLMRQFIRDIPDSLVEAARLDGAGEARIFLRVILPHEEHAEGCDHVGQDQTDVAVGHSQVADLHEQGHERCDARHHEHQEHE